MIYFVLGLIVGFVIMGLIFKIILKKNFSKYNSFFESTFNILDAMKGGEKDE